MDEMRCRPFIQFPWLSTCAAVRFILHANLNSAGASSLGLSPCNHLSDQNLVLLRLLILMVVHALNLSLSVCDGDTGILEPGLSLHFHCFNCHLRCNALLNHSRFRIPNPPSRFGRCTHFKFTMQFPFLMSSAPCQRNCLLILSIFLIVHLDSGNVVMW
jgi:hypothetical protein